MTGLRRRTREAYRHERAVVLQHLGTPTADQVRADIAANQARAAELRRGARKGGGPHAPEQQLGLVTRGRQSAGDSAAPEACHYCGVVGGHSGNCPVIS